MEKNKRRGNALKQTSCSLFINHRSEFFSDVLLLLLVCSGSLQDYIIDEIEKKRIEIDWKSFGGSIWWFKDQSSFKQENNGGCCYCGGNSVTVLEEKNEQSYFCVFSMFVSFSEWNLRGLGTMETIYGRSWPEKHFHIDFCSKVEYFLQHPDL